VGADTYDPVLGLLLMGTGNDNNSWGTNANNSVFTPAAQAIAGVNTISSTGGTVNLNGTIPPAGLRTDVHAIQVANGALISDLTVVVNNISKTWRFWNDTSGSFNMFVQVPGGVARTGPNAPGGLVQIPQRCMIDVTCDGNGNLIRSDDALIGTFSISGKPSPGPGELACDGASLLKAEFPDLNGKIGTTWGSNDSLHFTKPLLTDTNRFLRAGGGSGPAVGTYQSNQNASHTHSLTGSLSAGTLGTDTQGSHTHSASSSDSGHAHNWTIQGTVAGSGSPVGGAATEGTNNTGSSQGTTTTNSAVISTSIGAAGSHSHNITGAPSLGTVGVASQGGTEARPESAAVLICIRY
jgi:hypothetical protein